MKINEGYKSAVNRYNSLTNSDDGRNFVSMLNHLGIPREHLLWAVERIEGEGINVHVFIQMYKEWKKYVFPYCEKQNIDIPNITQQTFQQMCTMIDTSKRYWAFPNVVYNHNGIIVCKLNTYMDAHMLPIETTWCITKIPRRFEEFCGEGKDGYYIVNNSAQEPYQRTLAIIMNGEVEYWDSNNKRMAELPDYIARFKEYEALLPKEVKEIFYSDAAKQGEQIEQQNNKTDKNESKIMSKKNTIRLTESDLKRVISESVKRVLNESMGQQYRVDLKTNSRVNQQAISQLHSILNNSRGKQIECTLNMFYGNGFTCDATFTTNGNSICTINITSSTQYNKTFEYNTGNAVQQVLNIGRNLCNQWLQSIQQKNQQTMQQQ